MFLFSFNPLMSDLTIANPKNTPKHNQKNLSIISAVSLETPEVNCSIFEF